MSTEQPPSGQTPHPQDDEPHPRPEDRHHDDDGAPGAGHAGGSASGGTAAGAAPARSNDFFSWIRGLGIVRGGDRWMGGVASGLAHRWGLDPILVRGLFIVAAIFLGIGVLAYGLLWLLLPEADGRIHVQEAAHGRWSAGMTGGLIVTLLGMGGARAGFWFGEGGFGGAFWGLFWVAAVAFAIISLVRSARRPHVHSGAAENAAAPAAGADYYAKSATPPSYASPYASPNAAGYGSAPAAPPYYGWGLPPQPGPVPDQPATRPLRRPRASAPFVLVVLGVAALVAGALGVLAATGTLTLAASAVWAAVAVIVGLGILVAGLAGRRAGILTLFAIVALVASAAAQGADRLAGFSSRQASYAPAGLQQAVAGYDLSMERATLDLSRLDDAGPLLTDAVVPVKTTLSNVTITVPKGVPVKLQTSSTVAEVTAQGQSSAGLTHHDTTTYNADKPGKTLVLTLDATLSNVTITEER